MFKPDSITGNSLADKIIATWKRIAILKQCFPRGNFHRSPLPAFYATVVFLCGAKSPPGTPPPPLAHANLPLKSHFYGEYHDFSSYRQHKIRLTKNTTPQYIFSAGRHFAPFAVLSTRHSINPSHLALKAIFYR
ncbi:MAG: hypothetical protein HYZ65_15915 [Burkholderiales bacterium]|nr:hypothetical protein [Burkholderiales bacterium]